MSESRPQIKLELTDKQLEVLGTAIGKEVVRSFNAKQEYLYGSAGCTSKLTEKLGNTIVAGVASQLQYNPSEYAKIINLICDSFVKHITFHEKALAQLGYKIWGAKKTTGKDS